MFVRLSSPPLLLYKIFLSMFYRTALLWRHRKKKKTPFVQNVIVTL